MPDFTGQTLIVTGAGSGIGAATARRLSSDNANVVLAGRTRDKLESVASELPEDRTLVVQADVSEQEDAERLVSETLSRFGELHGLVCNAGIAAMGRMGALDRDDWDKVIKINVTGTYLTIRAAWDALQQTGDSVVATSSVSGLGGDWGGFAYNASKGGVSNMVRALALEAGTTGVRVNAVAPSMTDTDMAPDSAELVGKFQERIPLGRAATTAEVGDVIAFLLGPDARFVNGVVLPVDGGLSASNGQPPIG